MILIHWILTETEDIGRIQTKSDPYVVMVDLHT